MDNKFCELNQEELITCDGGMAMTIACVIVMGAAFALGAALGSRS